MLQRNCSSALLSLLTLLLLALLSPPLAAQADRYELGRRLRQFERQWEATESPTARRRACAELDQAVRLFFSLKLRDAGKAIDEARFALSTAQPPTPQQRYATSLVLKLDRRLLDRQQPVIDFVLERFYPVRLPQLEGLRLIVDLGADAQKDTFEFANLDTFPYEGQIRLPHLDEDADLNLRFRFEADGQLLAEDQLAVSVVLDRDERLARLRALDETLPSDGPARTTERLTLRHLTQLLSGLAKPGTPETDYPAARLLAEAERLARRLNEPDDSKPVYTPDQTGQFWLMLPTGNVRTIARIQVPAKAPPAGGWPVVFALHGAGGSENMFFDTYGHGKIANLAAERGWLLVAPRAALGAADLPALLEELAKLYPLDSSKVLLVGHSMGAGHALAAAAKEPGKYRGVAALGGGRPIRLADSLKPLPFFVGIGTKDFAYGGAKALGESLSRAGVKTVRYKEYPEIEHLVIVQEALPEVFQFFDACLKEAPADTADPAQR